MLSLLSLLLASGTVLKGDSEQWTSKTYPDPRTNSTQCNTSPNSTLCDPDHILTDQWRLDINDNIQRQVQRLRNADILYTEDAPPECHENSTDGVQIYVILAKRIHTANNQSITDTDLTTFGNELAGEYGLSDQTCKNFIILIGVEAAKLAYARTGCHLKLPPDLMERVFNQYTNLFNEKNYMEGLNKIIYEIGEQMIDPFKDMTSTSAENENQTTTIDFIILDLNNTASNDSLIADVKLDDSKVTTLEEPAPWIAFILLAAAILFAVITLLVYAISKRNSAKSLRMQRIFPTPTEPGNYKAHDISSEEYLNLSAARIKRDLESALKAVENRNKASAKCQIDESNKKYEEGDNISVDRNKEDYIGLETISEETLSPDPPQLVPYDDQIKNSLPKDGEAITENDENIFQKTLKRQSQTRISCKMKLNPACLSTDIIGSPNPSKAITSKSVISINNEKLDSLDTISAF